MQPNEFNRVPKKATPLAPSEALAVLRGILPPTTTKAGLDLVAAQSALETAWWGSKTGEGFYCWNFGNLTASPGQPWMTIGSRDGSTQGMRYAAYDSSQAGASAYVGWLHAHGLFDAANAGDLDAYMAGLQRGGYLGFIGRTTPSGHVVSQADYDTYRKGIAGILASLARIA